MAKKKKGSKPRRNRYTALEDYLNPESAMVQAAYLLDEAAFDAINSKNPEAMAGVARGWMELGAVIHNISTGGEEYDEEEEEDLTSETHIMGFGSPQVRETQENEYKGKS